MKQKSLKFNAIMNGIRQVCAFLFPLITFPYISRVLGSDGYGKYSFSQSITSYFILLAALGINTYSIREGAKIRDEKDKITKFCSQIFSINVFSGVISLTVLGILLVASTKVGEYTPYILIESTAIVMAVIGTNWINSIYEDFLYLTLRYIIVQGIALAAMFILVKQPDDLIIYCIIAVLATNGGNLINIVYVRKYIKVQFTFQLELKTHLKPLLVLFVNAIAILVYVNSDITMLGFYVDDSVVGIYSFVSKIYNILKQLINAIVIAALPRIAYVLKNNKNEYESYINRIFSALTLVMLPIVIGMLLMSDAMILIAGGKQYITGDIALKILSFATIFAIYASLFTNCILIVNQQEDKCLKATIISAGINVGLNIILLPMIGITGAAITTVIAEAVNCVLQIYYAKPFYDWKRLNFKGNVSCLISAVCVMIVCIICNKTINNVFIRMTIAVVIAAGVYLCGLVLFKNRYATSMILTLKNKLLKRGA